jgi:hypothetical protein
LINSRRLSIATGPHPERSEGSTVSASRTVRADPSLCSG